MFENFIIQLIYCSSLTKRNKVNKIIHFNNYLTIYIYNYKKQIVVSTLTKEIFLDKIFDYEKNKEWNFEGPLPVIIDFYADWCNPCKMLAPVLDQLSEEYKGKIIIYKVDTEAEQELSAAFGVRSIPSLLFCPIGEGPQMAHGALPKAQLKDIISKVLHVE